MNDLRKSRVFGIESRNWHLNALVGSYFSLDMRLYAEGYYLGANLLVGEINKGGPSNVLVYPICFLYRHFIEIALKGIIEGFSGLGYSVELDRIRRTHDLATLLDVTGNMVRKHFETSLSEDTKKTILEINGIDPKSQVFRYSVSKRGDQFFPNHDVIGLGTLKNKMTRVYDELLGTLIGIDEELNKKPKSSGNVPNIDEARD